ncbi:hypothetical protein [Micromonospora costi]|uniref:DUF4386 family protein n=1 Tax=Micromonospora costi TaxID=1530042 RepID=A0A3B0A7H0_9ACTN|nr:hypothetical protein [Micromonospora costi]RKN56094.1 hypothetical protein D7193_16240 [Micromonospora costi]
MAVSVDASSIPAAQAADVPRRRAWALAGAVGGLGGLVGLFVTVAATEADRALFVDNARYIASLDGNEGWVWAYQIVTSLAAGCLAVFAAGLRRRLAGREPAGSLVPDLAAVGLLLTAALLLVGGGVATELYFSLLHVDETDPDTVAGLAAGYNTFAWVWAGTGLTAAAVAVAGLRRRAVSRWFAVFSLLMALLVAATQLVPLQYLALVPGGLWATVAGLTFALERRRIGN